ncbi:MULTISPECIES: universal stress protein [unclassified Nonomuraea]|uniref:universal stress protein n=1 Tax=unclassified Nonomuraea TaxID=2593643 RepID=UPI0033DDB319
MIDEPAGRPVLVGYDDSTESRHALHWAVADARLRGLPVLVCHALHWPYASRPVAQEIIRHVEPVALGIVDEGVRRARELAPELDVQPLLGRGTPSAVLLEAAREAELTVLGSRGQGGFEGLQVGSAAVQVPAHSVTPVVVVRPPLQPPTRQDVRVVVGLDGSPASLAAFDLALDEAALREGTVTALCCWTDCGSSSWQEPLPFVDSHALRKGAENRFREVVSHLARRRPEVTVVTEFLTERPQRVLIETSKDATLLVLGNRGNEAPPCLLLGAVTQAALLEARCPVAVTPGAVLNPRLPVASG